MNKTVLMSLVLAAVAVPAMAGELTEKIKAKYTVKSTDTWYGGQRTVFDFKGYDAWVIEPPVGVKAAEGRPWTWTMQWRTAFVPRTGVPKLLKLGYHHVSIDTFALRMTDEGVKLSKEFQDFLVNDLGFAPKARLIGMSWGGFFSTRYAAAHPECVEKIYYDAPLLNFATFTHDKGPWVAPAEGWAADPRMPVNMAGKIAASKIPLLLLYGGVDTVVPPKDNCLRFIADYKKAGGTNLKVVPRGSYAHHPHGVEESDDMIVNFFK